MPSARGRDLSASMRSFAKRSQAMSASQLRGGWLAMNTRDINWIAMSLEGAGAEYAIALGAHIVSERDGYSHHGIYAGNGQVIHYGGFHHSIGRRPVESISLRSFAAGKRVGVQSEPHALYRGMDAVARARSRLGEDRYRILTNNCEHFCTWCVQGVARSEQVLRCFMHPWSCVKTMRVLLRRSHAVRHGVARILRHARRIRSSVLARCFAPQLGRA